MCQKVAGSIPGRGGYRRQLMDISSHINVSFSLLPTLKSINIPQVGIAKTKVNRH